MAGEFYTSSAVTCTVDRQNFASTFDLAMEQSPFLRLLIIEDAGRPAGYGQLSFTYSNEVGGMVVFMEELYIRQAHRGKGYGHDFFAFVERAYPAVRRFRLEVRADNTKAIALYRRLGYSNIPYTQMGRDC